MFVQERGGVRIDSFNVSAPSSEIRVAEDAIEVIGYGKSFRFPKSEIRELRFRRGLLSDGVQLIHSRPEHPSILIFWSPAIHSLHQAIREHGYQIADLPQAWWERLFRLFRKRRVPAA